MLYLFNSGYRAFYSRNVLNTLFIPEGGTNEYRYKFRNNQGETASININPANFENLKQIKQGSPVVVIFVDRYKGGEYYYHPLRKGSFIGTRESNNYLYFNVQLDTFLYPRNIESFNQAFKKCFYPKGVVQLTNNDPYNTSDGWYAMIEESLFAIPDEFIFAENAWTECVNSLQNCKVFSSPKEFPKKTKEDVNTNDLEFVFMRCNIQDNTGKKISASLVDNKAVFYLNRGKKYQLELSYKYPPQLTDTNNRAWVSYETGESLKLFNHDNNIDSYSNSFHFQFTTKRYIEENNDSIQLKFSSPKSNVSVYGTDSIISLRIQEPNSFWFELAIALLLYSIFGVYIVADLSKITEITFSTIVSAFWDKAVAGFFQALVLFWIFRLIGKKIF